MPADPVPGGDFPLYYHAAKRQNRAYIVFRQLRRARILATGRVPLVTLGTAANVEIRDSATTAAPELDVLAGLQAEPRPRNDPMPPLAAYDAGRRQLAVAANAAMIARLDSRHKGYRLPLFRHL